MDADVIAPDDQDVGFLAGVLGLDGNLLIVGRQGHKLAFHGAVIAALWPFSSSGNRISRRSWRGLGDVGPQRRVRIARCCRVTEQTSDRHHHDSTEMDSSKHSDSCSLCGSCPLTNPVVVTHRSIDVTVASKNQRGSFGYVRGDSIATGKIQRVFKPFEPPISELRIEGLLASVLPNSAGWFEERLKCVSRQGSPFHRRLPPFRAIPARRGRRHPAPTASGSRAG